MKLRINQISRSTTFQWLCCSSLINSILLLHIVSVKKIDPNEWLCQLNKCFFARFCIFTHFIFLLASVVTLIFFYFLSFDLVFFLNFSISLPAVIFSPNESEKKNNYLAKKHLSSRRQSLARIDLQNSNVEQ